MQGFLDLQGIEDLRAYITTIISFRIKFLIMLTSEKLARPQTVIAAHSVFGHWKGLIILIKQSYSWRKSNHHAAYKYAQ